MLSREDVEEIVKTALAGAFSDHEQREASALKDTVNELLYALVPGGDPLPHREYHQAKVEAARAAREAEDAKRRLYEYLFRVVAEKSLEGLARVFKVLFWLALLAVFAKFGIIIPAWMEKLL